ncbi:MAG: HAMP domain-containing histidine kinase [Deltaproteobacteria bacterium]|nr:HAMP domain-containing histidine kinase [Deltaproteobacteria bacterium]
MRPWPEIALGFLVASAATAAVAFGKSGLDRALGGPRNAEEADLWVSDFVRSHPSEFTFSLSDLPSWRTDPLLVDTAGSYPDSLQYCDAEAFSDWEGHAQSKGRVWFEATRDPLGSLPESFFVRPPFLHLSGRSYVALALERYPDRFGTRAWVEAHARYLHASELSVALPFEPTWSAAESFVAGLSSSELDQLLDRPSSLLTGRAFLSGVTSEEPGAPPRYGVHPRDDWDSFMDGKSARTSPTHPGDACVTRTDSICWRQDVDGAESRIRSSLALALVSIVSLVALLSLRRGRLLRDENETRRFILQTLTHELRTPVASLRLSLEALRSGFDRLPEDAQGAFLRMCEDLQRLRRLTDASTQYLRAKDSRTVAFEPTDVPSLHDLIEGVLETHPQPIALEGDARLRCDPYWVAVCADNLVRNALCHGRPPVSVTCVGSDDGATIVVADGGEMKLTPEAMRMPFTKGEGSAGLGLGLSVVSRLVEEMGGRLEIDREPSRVALHLPHLP